MHSVLVVDNDDALRRTVMSWIDSFGYEVQEAPTAEEVLKRAAEPPEHERVEEEVDRARVQERGRDEAPPLAVGDEGAEEGALLEEPAPEATPEAEEEPAEEPTSEQAGEPQEEPAAEEQPEQQEE